MMNNKKGIAPLILLILVVFGIVFVGGLLFIIPAIAQAFTKWALIIVGGLTIVFAGIAAGKSESDFGKKISVMFLIGGFLLIAISAFGLIPQEMADGKTQLLTRWVWGYYKCDSRGTPYVSSFDFKNNPEYFSPTARFPAMTPGAANWEINIDSQIPLDWYRVWVTYHLRSIIFTGKNAFWNPT